MNFTTPLSAVPRIGPVFQKRLKKLGITTVRDLLFYFPRTYEDLSKITPIAEIKEGTFYCIAGEILEISEERTFKKRMHLTHAIVRDDTGTIKALWFNQPYLPQTLRKGERMYLAGRVVRDAKGIYLSNPIYEKFAEGEMNLIHTGRIIPVYPETRGISSRWLRSIIRIILQGLTEKIEDAIPEKITQEERFLPLQTALKQIHFPDTLENIEKAKKRFSFEELFFISLFVLTERKKIASVKAVPIPFDEQLMKKFTSSLPFQLTDAQKKAAWHILKDLEKPRPMNRLLQGDVGSGKTVVATMASLAVTKKGYQAVFMAPTEILAQQHFKTVGQLLAPFKITAGLLTGKADRFISPKLPNDYIEISRKKLLEKALKGDIDILIGTHALIQKEVRFGKLALVIVDEQHRFGVKQRAQLLRHAQLIPHLLSMTATPIPRTLALTIYGDLDLTLIDELPKGRKKIETRIISPQEREQAYQFIAKEVKQGHQVFVICPRIEKSEIRNPKSETPNKKNGWSETKAVKEEYEKLSKEIFPNLRIAMLHGKMAQKEKEEIMRKFKFGKIDILVSTSVVEVGVDIPNASVMMIEGADRFGLAQLHQFRGRVGRSDQQSHCFLFTESSSRTVAERLRALVRLESGFELAEKDLHMRGPGDFNGVKQWGIPDFAMQQLSNVALVEKAREAAKNILEKDIALHTYPLLKKRVEELREKLHLE
ncbi:MAG: ATP-dependent DNA helicase RecG [Candidatus Wildermuthbacteria bacterium]|nr:ATP-dependent DNA helicase RecG [Candidatus Wildermuthbacteria bacterium]